MVMAVEYLRHFDRPMVEAEFPRYHQLLLEAVLAAGCDAELTTISGGGHGFNADQSKVADAALFAWFDKYLKAGK